MTETNGTKQELTYTDGDAEQVAYRIVAAAVGYEIGRAPVGWRLTAPARWLAVRAHLERIREACFKKGTAGL